MEIKKQLTELLRQGKVRESRSDSAVGTLFIPKADGSKRWCMDMRPVNNATIPDKNKSPLQDISRERIKGATVFTRLDMKDGYHHLRIREGDERHTAFLTEYGLFEWTVVCFGLRNAPAEFARFMSSILMDYLNEFVVVYFDDIVIFSENEKEHEEHVKKVLRRLKEARINLKIKKCEFGVRETSFLGDIVNGDTTRMQDEKVKAILQWPSPKILSIWKSSEDWWDITGSISRIFYEESKRYLRKRNSVGRQRTKKYSKKLKTSLKETKYLAYSTLRKKSWCKDTSAYAIGTEISQLGKEGRRRPILFYSRRLTPAEEKYSMVDKEMLAIVQVLKKYPHFLRETKFPVVIKTDHRNPTTFTTNKQLNGRQARWAEELSAYNFVIEHVPGKQT